MPRDGKQRFSKVEYSTTILGGGTTAQGVAYPGGLDLTTPTLRLQPGALRDCVNFEVALAGGYGRIPGYERFDGRTSPSSVNYVALQTTNMLRVPAVGSTVWDVDGVTHATVVATTGGVLTGPGSIIVANVQGGTGSFPTPTSFLFEDAGLTLLIGAYINPYTTLVITPQQDAQYKAGAADVYRALIGAVPGEGPILGVVATNFGGVDKVFAFRNNVGSTAANIYVSSTSGWTLVPLFNQVSFTLGGASQPPDGTTLTQGGVTATIKRVVTASGTWTGNTAAGILVITNPSGGNFAAGAATITGGINVTLGGIQTAITIAPGGKYQFSKYNYFGQPTTKRIYGADGVNKAFEFDGTTYVPITTGLLNDHPSYIASHLSYLFLGFEGSIIFSAPGSPYRYSAVDGAGQIAVGDSVSGMITLPGSQTTSTLAIYQQANTSFLYGNDVTSFALRTFNNGIGALPFSIQNLFDTFVFDNLGVITTKTTLNYGNFLPNTLTRNIYPFIVQERSKVTCSVPAFDKAQYRVFFSDGYGIWITSINQQYLGAGIVQFPNPVYCVDGTDLIDHSHAIYFGSNDGNGFVYQMDKGTSFDGGELLARFTMAWDAIKSPRILKRFRALSLEFQSSNYAAVSLGYQLGYSTSQIIQQATANLTANIANSAIWDSFTWDAFVWDGVALFPTDLSIDGTAENIQVSIYSKTNYIQPFNVNSVIYHYTPRRGIRV